MDGTDVPDLSFPPEVRIGPLRLASRYLLSPLAGYTNLHFRRIVRELGGVGLATTDLVSASALLRGSAKSFVLIETCPEDRPLAVQIFGRDPVEMRDAAQLLEARGVDAVDINMGCPVDHVTKGGGGAGMMCRPESTVDLVRQVVESVRIPVTVKMRLGWDAGSITAPRFAREFEQAGVAGVAIHGRTREQGFSGSVDRNGIRQVVEAVERIPVIGNGDVRSVADAARMLRETGCRGVSIGRGALGNPWIFRQLVEQETTGASRPPGTFDDRLALLRRQFGFLVDRHGDAEAIVLFRKMGHWWLKGMCVRSGLRDAFQKSRTRDEWDAVLDRIAAEGPNRGDRSGLLPELHIPVPAGPHALW